MAQPTHHAPHRRAMLPLLAAGALALAIALTALTGGSFSSRTGYDRAAQDVAYSDWWTLWAIPPVEVALTAVLLAVLLLHGRPDARGRAFGAAGIILLAICSPVAGLAQSGLLAAHMTQHVLIGGFAPLLALTALPRAIPGRTPRRPWHAVLHPAVAFALWIASTVAWLLPDIHHRVLSSQTLWITQQAAFFIFGAIMWAPVAERFAPAPRWFGTGAKAGYMAAVWVAGLTIANLYWFSGTAFYPSHAAAARAWGLTPLQDQAHAGTVMMLTHCMLAFGAVGVLFFREASERSLQQRLVEAGVDADEARWTVRYGDAAQAARDAGIPFKLRAGID